MRPWAIIETKWFAISTIISLLILWGVDVLGVNVFFLWDVDVLGTDVFLWVGH